MVSFQALREKCFSNNIECTIRNVSLINGEVQVVKCMVDNVAIDITYRQGSSIACSILLEIADQHFAQDHLFKRSVILIKVLS